jgi:RND family efflux transporter MFP subunit
MYRNTISSATSQRVEKIFVNVGDAVKRGDLLVEMENINYLQAKIQLENLIVDKDRLEALYKAGGVSAQQYDQIVTQLRVAQENIDNLKRNTQLLSPIDGVVTKRNFDDGDIAAGQPILEVMQIQPVKLMINLSEEFYPKVKKGTKVQINLDVYPSKSFEGSVFLIHPTIDVATRNFTAEVRIDNPGLKIRPGMFARARVDFGTKEGVVVPDMAVFKQAGTNDKFVYVLNGDRVSFRQITLGKRVDSIYEVVVGLNEGEVVVISGQTPLKEGSLVEISESQLNIIL